MRASTKLVGGLLNGVPSSSLSCPRGMAKCFTIKELLYRNSANCWRMLNMSSLVYVTAFGQDGTYCPSGKGSSPLSIGFLCRSQSSRDCCRSGLGLACLGLCCALLLSRMLPHR